MFLVATPNKEDVKVQCKQGVPMQAPATRKSEDKYNGPQQLREAVHTHARPRSKAQARPKAGPSSPLQAPRGRPALTNICSAPRYSIRTERTATSRKPGYLLAYPTPLGEDTVILPEV